MSETREQRQRRRLIEGKCSDCGARRVVDCRVYEVTRDDNGDWLIDRSDGGNP